MNVIFRYFKIGLFLLHNNFFSQNQSTPVELYQEVVRLVRVHDELVNLYKFLDDIDEDNYDNDHVLNSQQEEEINARLEESLQKGRDEIYFGDEQVIPEELKELVDQDNGWTVSQRKEYIRRLVFNDESSRLSCTELQHKMQLLLLHWCEWQLDDGSAPELVQLGYRDLSTKTSAPTQDNNRNNNNNNNEEVVDRRPRRRQVAPAAFAERSREQNFDSDDDDDTKNEEDDRRPPPSSANRKHSLEDPPASASSSVKRRRMTDDRRRHGFSDENQTRRGGRFGSPDPPSTHRDDDRRRQVQGGEKPSATICCCSSSSC